MQHPAPMPATDGATLGDFPDLGYLFNEFYRACRHRPGGDTSHRNYALY